MSRSKGPERKPACDQFVLFCYLIHKFFISYFPGEFHSFFSKKEFINAKLDKAKDKIQHNQQHPFFFLFYFVYL